MATVGAVIIGMDRLRSTLSALPMNIRRKVCSPALRAGAKVIAAQAKIEVPKKKRKLERSIRVRVGKYKRRSGDVVMLAQTGKGFFKGNTYYGGFVHMGHGIGHRSRAVANLQKAKSRLWSDDPRRAKIQAKIDRVDPRRRVPPNPFLKRAHNKSRARAEKVVITEMVAGIRRLATSGGGSGRGDKFDAARARLVGAGIYEPRIH
jgi:HK97 gp10 family phage protein